MTTIDDATAVRLALVHHGFTPLPLFGKEPPIFGKNNERRGLAGWQHLRNVTAAQISMWAHSWPDAVNTGILTALAPALDLDIYSEPAAIAVEELVRERFEARGHVPVRIGKPPKRAILLRTLQPFDKLTVNLTRAQHEGLGEKIELLCDRQQLVAFGVHPETREPYRWHGGSPWIINRDDLAYIDADDARALVADVVDLLTREHGYSPRTASRAPSVRTGLKNEDSGSESWGDLITNIINGQGLHESVRDLACKFIRAGTIEGAVVNTLRALMEAAPIPHDERWKERFNDIPRAVNTASRLIEAERQLTAR